MNNEHNRYRCTGQYRRRKTRSGKKTYEWTKCTAWWYICQQGSHDAMGDERDAYLVCHDCPNHPSGGPDGTGPSGSFARADSSQTSVRDEWQWDNESGRYYRIDENGNIEWTDPGQSSTSGQ